MSESNPTLDALALHLDISDPTDAAEVGKADAAAYAMLTMALSFIRNRTDESTAISLAYEFFGKSVPVAGPSPARPPAGNSLPTLHPAPHRDPALTVQGRAQGVLDFLNQCPPVDADMAARSSIWGSAAYLRQHQGDDSAVQCLKGVERLMSIKAWFEQLPAASVARN